MRAFATSSVATCDVALGSELTLRERQALMDVSDWSVLIDRLLWDDMTPTERAYARERFYVETRHSGSSEQVQS